MKPKNRNQRLTLLAVGGCALAGAAALVFSALQQNVAYFYSPMQIANGEAQGRTHIRLGGLVMDKSVSHPDELTTHFSVTDGARDMKVEYTGILPDLFREGQGVIAQGRIREDGVFVADTILAKHDENYRPKELEAALKEASEQSE